MKGGRPLGCYMPMALWASSMAFMQPALSPAFIAAFD
jgi:hypothetical protein